MDMSSENRILHTVNGPLASDQLGFTLPHEHIMVDFGGAATAVAAEQIVTVLEGNKLEINNLVN